MELELGLKFTRIADEFTSDFQLAKDRAGPLFLSRETETMFLLTAHLKGYNRTNIKIDINEDGSLIGISGEKQVQETVMVGWRMYKKDTEKKGFKKLFRIPKEVILDKIEAKFDEDESTLTISMPKKVRGIQGKTLEEVNENEELVKEGSRTFQTVEEKVQGKDEKSEPINKKEDDKADQIDTTHDLEQSKVEPDLNYEQKDETPKEETEKRKNVNCVNEGTEVKRDQEEKNSDKVSETVNDISEVVDQVKDDDSQRINEKEEKKFKICVPIVASSALLLSLVVFVFQIIRSKNQTRRKD